MLLVMCEYFTVIVGWLDTMTRWEGLSNRVMEEEEEVSAQKNDFSFWLISITNNSITNICAFLVVVRDIDVYGWHIMIT